MATAKDELHKIRSQEKKCVISYKNIEKQLKEAKKEVREKFNL